MLAEKYTPFPWGCLRTPSALPEWLTQLLSLVRNVGHVLHSRVVPRHCPALLIHEPWLV